MQRLDFLQMLMITLFQTRPFHRMRVVQVFELPLMGYFQVSANIDQELYISLCMREHLPWLRHSTAFLYRHQLIWYAEHVPILEQLPVSLDVPYRVAALKFARIENVEKCQISEHFFLLYDDVVIATSHSHTIFFLVFHSQFSCGVSNIAVKTSLNLCQLCLGILAQFCFPSVEVSLQCNWKMDKKHMMAMVS